MPQLVKNIKMITIIIFFVMRIVLFKINMLINSHASNSSMTLDMQLTAHGTKTKWVQTRWEAYILAHNQAWIQRFKEVSQTDYVPGFTLAAAWISRSTSIIICIELWTLIHWLGAHQCKISWRLHLSGKTQYLRYWLTVNSAKHQ